MFENTDMCGPRRVSTMFLNRDYEKIFKPFYIINTIFCLRIYNVSHNMAFPITKYNYILTFILNLIIILTCSFLNLSRGKTKFIYLWVYIQHASTYITATIINFTHRSGNLTLLMNLQKVSDGIRSAEDTKRLSIISRVSCLILTAFYIAFLGVKVAKIKSWPNIFYYSLTFHYEAKMINGIIILYFLIFKLRKWKSTVAQLVVNRNMNENIDLKKLKYYFRKIMKSMNLFREMFQQYILLHVVMTFTQTLTQIEVVLLWNKSGTPGYKIEYHTVSVSFWIFKRLVIDVLLCGTSEILYKEVEDTRVKILDEYCQVPESHLNTKQGLEMKQFKKYIVREIDTKFKKISACGLFTIDASLPMRLGAVITTYTLVLLQFEHLY